MNLSLRRALLLSTLLTTASSCEGAETDSKGPQDAIDPRAAERASPASDYGGAVGWGEATGGGAGGQAYTVDNLGDDGPGSLRAGLEDPAPLVVVFKEGLAGKILLTRPIRALSHKTVDGRNRDITLSPADAANPTTALVIERQSNVIVFNLNFDGRQTDWDRDGEGSDGITIRNSSRIWVHKCTFKRWVDGAIDARTDGTSPLSSEISITSNRFEDIYQAINLTADGVTFAWNHCSRVRKRCMKIIQGKAHSFNNLIEGWNGPEIQVAKDGGQLYSEGNVFSPDGFDGINKEDGGKIEMSKNRYKRGAFVVSSSKVSDACRSQSAGAPVLCDEDATCWGVLEKKIVTDAGRVVP